MRITTVPISLKFLITGQMKFMKENGFDVIMMSADGTEIEEVVRNENCPHEIVPLTRKITPFQDLKALWVLYRKLRKIRPEIVHSHTPKAGLIGMLAAWMAKVPIRLHTVAGLPLESATGIKKKLLLFIEWLTYKCASEVWPNSRSLHDFIAENELTSKNKLKVIGKGSSNGINISEFNSENLENTVLNKIRTKIGFDPNNTYLLFVGRIVKDKGIEELVEVFQKLKLSHKNLKLILVGPLEKELDPLSNECLRVIESDKDIIKTGFSNQVKYYMHLSDLFIFPSHREGFPNVPMQAGLMKCPVIASRINGNVDIVGHEINGLLHEKGNVNDLFEKVNYALNNRMQMKEMNANLEEKIKKYFDRTVVQNLILDSYNAHLNSLGLKTQRNQKV